MILAGIGCFLLRHTGERVLRTQFQADLRGTPAVRPEVVQQCLVPMFGTNQLLRLALILTSGRFTSHSLLLGLSAFPVA